MANAVRGEVEFQAQGKTWVLKLSTNTMCHIEDVEQLDGGIDEYMQRWQANKGMTFNRQLFAYCLRHHHGEMTAAEAGALMDEIGAVPANVLLSRTIVRGLNGPEALAKPARPPEGAVSARAGIGPASTPPGAAAATTPRPSGRRPRTK